MLTPKAFTTATKGKIGTSDEERFQSVLMELDLAITFCAMVRFAKDKGNTDRNIENAENVYSVGVRFLFNADLSCEARRELIDKLALLHTKIRDFDHQMIPAPGVQVPSAHAF
jgi:Neuraminidase (sialidase)